MHHGYGAVRADSLQHGMTLVPLVVREDERVLRVPELDTLITPYEGTDAVHHAEAPVGEAPNPIVRPLFVNVQDSSLAWNGSREKDYWTEGHERIDERISSTGWQVLPNLEGYHKVEFFIELERLSQVSSEEAVGRDPQRALVDPGSIHPEDSRDADAGECSEPAR